MDEFYYINIKHFYIYAGVVIGFKLFLAITDIVCISLLATRPVPQLFALLE